MWTSKMGTGTECGLQIWVPEHNVDSVPVPIIEVQVVEKTQYYDLVCMAFILHTDIGTMQVGSFSPGS